MKLPHENGRRLVSIDRAREIVGVSRRTIYNWIQDNKIEYVRTAGGAVRIYEDTLWRMPGTRTGARGSWSQHDE